MFCFCCICQVCKIIDGFPEGTDILTRISAGATFYYNYDDGNNTCLDLQQTQNDGWDWQVKYLFGQIKSI